MSEFTYEKAPCGQLETYEWDNIWWEHTDHKDHPRFLYVGDSISCGIRGVWNSCEGIEWYFDSCGTSKALDNPSLLPLIVSVKEQMQSCDAILINNGLHGWHLSTEEYAAHYETLLKALRARFPSTPIFLVTTTSVTNDDERNAAVLARNAAVKVLAEKLSLPVIDLYPVSTEIEHTNGVHLVKEGYIKLRETVLAALKKSLR